MSTTLNLATQLNTDGTLQANSILGPELANGSVTARTINADVQTDTIAEGNVNFYFTNARAREAITVTGGGSFDNTTGVITVGGPGLNTTNVIEGANLYFTNARSRAAISAFDESIIYNAETGEIRANIVLFAGTAVYSVNGQSGVVTLTAANIAETATLQYFTNARARAALSPDSTINYVEANGWISIGQAVEPTSNVQFNELDINLIAFKDTDGNVELEAGMFYSANANAIIVGAGLLPNDALANTMDIGSDSQRWRDGWFDTLNANGANFANVVTADEFRGTFFGEKVQTITVTSDSLSLVIDGAANPPLFVPKSSKVYFDVSSDTLNGIGFDLGDISTGVLGNSTTIEGVTYTVNGNVSAGYEDYIASFSGSNTRALVWLIPQSTPSTILYYATDYTSFSANIVVAPPLSADELVEGVNNQFYTEAKLTNWLFSHADANVGLSYNEETELLTLAQDISPVAGPTFANVTANVMTANSFVGDLYGNIYGQLANLDPLSTDDLGEGQTNYYFTTERARTSVNAGTGLEYQPLTGVFSLNAVAGLNAGAYGNSSHVAQIIIDSYGRITTASNVLAGDVYNSQTYYIQALQTNVAVEGQTEFAVNDGYTNNNWLQVFVNGVLQQLESDWVGNNSSNISLVVPANVNDVVTIIRSSEQPDMSNIAGNIMPATSNTYDLGSPELRWRELWLSGNTIHLGNIRISENDGVISAPMRCLFREVFPGNVEAKIGSSRFYPPANIVVTQVYASLGVAAETAVSIDVKMNGTSIFDTEVPSIDAGNHLSNRVSINIPVDVDSYLTTDITEAGGQDLTVFIVYTEE